MSEEQDRQGEMENQDADEAQSREIRDEMKLLAPSANDYSAMMMGYGPPPSFGGAGAVQGLAPARGLQPPGPRELWRMPQATESMGFIYGPPSMLDGAGRVDVNAGCGLQMAYTDRVVTLTYVGDDGKVFEFTLSRRCTQITIGRAETCDLILNDDSVSDIHAIVSFGRGRAFVKHVGNSATWTTINGRRLVRDVSESLNDGVILTCGKFAIDVSITG